MHHITPLEQLDIARFETPVILKKLAISSRLLRQCCAQFDIDGQREKQCMTEDQLEQETGYLNLTLKSS